MNSLTTFVAIALFALVIQAHAQDAPPTPAIDYTLRFYTNHNMTVVYVGGKEVVPKASSLGMMEIPINSCDDIVFVMRKDSQLVSSAISVFLVHTGITTPPRDEFYATRQVIKGQINDYSIIGATKVAYTFQYDPSFDESKMSPLFAIANAINVYQNQDEYDDGFISITDIRKEIALGISGGNTSIPKTFFDADNWRTGTPVDAVLTDNYDNFKSLFKIGALPLNWRDGYMRAGYYALKICNPICAKNEELTVKMDECYARPIF